MIRSLCVIVALAVLSFPSSGQTVGLKLGSLYEISAKQMQTQRMEVDVTYPLFQELSVTFATGYYRYHVDERTQFLLGANPPITLVSPAMTFHYIPAAVGLRYTLTQRQFSPYLIAEYGRLFDVSATNRYNKDSYLTRWGAGVQYKLRDNIMLDVSAKYMSSDFHFGMEFMAGISILL